MTSPPESSATTSPSKPYFSRAGLVAGALAMAPMVVGQAAFGFVFGTLAAQKALTAIESVAMSGLVFAGLAQAVGLQAWSSKLNLAALLALALITLTVNLRYFLMSLTFRPWLGSLPAWQVYPTLLFMTDPGWLQSMRYHAQGGRDVSFLLGGGLFVYLFWLPSTYLGYMFSTWMTDPKRFGIDLIIPVFFAALLVPTWKGAWHAVPWVVAGIVATGVKFLGLDYWYIVAGAISGALTAGVLRDE